jgi:hypothetical protein
MSAKPELAGSTSPVSKVVASIIEIYSAGDWSGSTGIEILLGLAKGYGTFAVTLMGIVYNGGRWYLTKEVGVLAADVAKNEKAPALRDYKTLFVLHRIFRLLMWVSLAVLGANIYSWMSSYIG